VQQVTKTFEACITICAGLVLDPGQEKKFDGRFRLPSNVQPTYEGKFTQHLWRFRARLDVLGKDPDSGWFALRVLSQLRISESGGTARLTNGTCPEGRSASTNKSTTRTTRTTRTATTSGKELGATTCFCCEGKHLRYGKSEAWNGV
jgi:hypothetical protein